MSNNICMLEKLSKLCTKDRFHQHLMGGRAANAAVYPAKLLKASLEGISDTRDAQETVSSMFNDGWDTELLLSIEQLPEPSSKSQAFPDGSIPVQDGGHVEIKYEPHNFWHKYLDEYTREVLPHELVRAAIAEELE